MKNKSKQIPIKVARPMSFRPKIVQASALYFRDGRVSYWEPSVAYNLWLAGGCAIRPAGDKRTVYPWECL